jgi:hypothetical protein
MRFYRSLFSLVFLFIGPSPLFFANHNSGELPPECISIYVTDNNGLGTTHKLSFCGQGSGAESPLPDRFNGRHFYIDGDPISVTHSIIFAGTGA